MTTIKIYGIACEGGELARELVAVRPPAAQCALIGPANWRRTGITSQEARRRATREGWKRVKNQRQYGPVRYDLCPSCASALELALKAAQS